MARTRPPIDGGTILITGASAGIGEALARELAPRAAALVLVARRVDRLEALAAELAGRHPAVTVHPIGCDLARPDDVDRLLAELASRGIGVDVLVNNAGLGHARLFDRAAWPALEQLLRVNVVALARLTHALVGPMVERGRGGVLNIGSGAGFTIFPGGAAYIGSKHFVYGFTEALRLDLDGTGVVVAQVCPGPVATEFGAVSSGGRDAGARAGLRPPAGLRISAEHCAREAVAGFARGKALIIPGRRFRALMALTRTVAPHGVQRRALAPTARRMRARRAAPAQSRTPR